MRRAAPDATPVDVAVAAARGLLLLGAFGISLFFTGGQGWLYAPAVLALLGFFVATAPAGLWQGTIFPRTAPALLLAAFGLYVTISLPWSQTPFPSLVTYLVFCSLPLTVFGLLLSPRRSRDITVASRSIEIATVVLAVWAILQVTLLHDLYHGRAASPFADPNNLAALLNLSLIPMLAIAVTAPPGTGRLAASAGAMLLFAGLVATGSRGGLISLTLMVAILLVALRRTVWERRRGIAAIAALSVAITIVLRIVAPHASGHLGDMNWPGDEAAMNRLILWRATLHMIAQHPFTGSGLGSFYLAYAGERPVADRVSAGQWAHDDLLQFAADMGVAAPVLFVAFLVALYARHRRAMRTCPDDRARAALLGPLLAVFGLTAHAMVEFQFYVMPSLIVCGVRLAAWHAQADRLLGDEPARRPAPGWQRATAAALPVIVAILLAVPAVCGGAAGYYLDRALDAIRHGRPQTFSADLDRADAVAPASFIDARVQRAGLYIDLLKTPPGLFTPNDQKTMAAYVLSTLDVAERTMPLWYDVNDKRAALYLAMKNRLAPDWRVIAQQQLRVALRKNPLDADGRLQLVALLVEAGQRDAAIEQVERGLERPHDAAAGKSYEDWQEKLLTPRPAR